MRRHPGRHQLHVIERERGAGGATGGHVALVHRVERAAEQAEPGRHQRSTSRESNSSSPSAASSTAASRAARHVRPGGLEQHADAVAGDGGDGQERQAQRRGAGLQRAQALRLVEGVDLVGGDQLRLVEECRGEQPELAADDLEILDRVAAGGARHVDHVEEHLGAFDVTQELVAEPMTGVRALDQAGHVGDDEAAVVAESAPRPGWGPAW